MLKRPGTTLTEQVPAGGAAVPPPPRPPDTEGSAERWQGLSEG